MYPCVSWFDTARSVTETVQGSLSTMRLIDEGIASRETVSGFCIHCGVICTLQVSGGSLFGADVNLREGMVCQSCGLNSRSRLLFHVARQTFGPDARLALLEAFSPLARYVSAVWPGTRLSEFRNTGARSGQEGAFYDPDGGQRHATHQDMMALSFPDASLDGILHSDVLEHVSDVRRGLSECHRVLSAGGIALFTMPWFPWLSKTLVRGALDAQGSLQEYLRTELHGDSLRPAGIYTYYNFGADFAEFLGEAGFYRVSFGVCYDPYAGFLTNNYRYGDDFLMLPTVIRAAKAF